MNINADCRTDAEANENIHEEIQVLLESSLMDCNTIISSLEIMRSQVINGEDLVRRNLLMMMMMMVFVMTMSMMMIITYIDGQALMQLDTARNNLLTLNTTISVLSVAIAFSAYITGAFGMNLDQTRWLQHVSGGFTGVVVCTLALIFISSIAAVWYFRHVGMLPVMAMSRRKSF